MHSLVFAFCNVVLMRLARLLGFTLYMFHICLILFKKYAFCILLVILKIR